MALVQVKQLATQAGGATSIALTMDSPITAGSHVLVYASCSSNTAGALASCSDGTNAFQNALTQVNDTTNDQCSRLFYYESHPGGTSTITVSLGSSYPYRSMEVVEFDSLGSFVAAIGAFQNSPSSATDAISSGNLTTSVGDYVFGFSQETSSGTVTPSLGTGFTGIGTGTPDSTAEYKVATGTSTAATYTSASGDSRLTLAIAFAPAASTNTYNYSGSGGIQSGGSATTALSNGTTTFNYSASGGLTAAGAAATEKRAANKTAYVRLSNADGTNVYSIDLYQDIAFEYIASGGITSGGVATTDSIPVIRNYVAAGGITSSGVAGTEYFSPYIITLTSIESNTSLRLVSDPDLVIGDKIEWDNVVGGTRDDVTVNTDATWTAVAGVTAFDWRVNDGTGWGAYATQYIISSSSYTATGGATFGGSAITGFQNNNVSSYQGSGGISSGGTSAYAKTKSLVSSGGISSSGVAITSLFTNIVKKIKIQGTNRVVNLTGANINHTYEYWFVTDSASIDLDNYNGVAVNVVDSGTALAVVDGQTEVLVPDATIGQTYLLVGFDSDESHYFRFSGTVIQDN